MPQRPLPCLDGTGNGPLLTEEVFEKSEGSPGALQKGPSVRMLPARIPEAGVKSAVLLVLLPAATASRAMAS